MDIMTENSEITSEATSDTPPSESPKKPVKSNAVVKYSAVSTPATFAQLQCNTDLNHPPSNWLSTSAESYGLQNVWSRNTGFSSFRMAHMFPDCVGEVDVVSDAENIKKLLKIPYSDGTISMMVHRIENTLLLDDFDIHKYLLRQAENDWEWLKKFFYEHVFHNLGDKEKRLYPKANSRNALQQKNLISKFFYHSLLLTDKQEHDDEKPSFPVEHKLDSSLPEPSQEEKLPDPQYNHSFARNVVWTFENIQMLIGTDMPIFGGQTHPCISLRLRDASKPINVLTGIDYWLDNLMCNVPELVMCYHLDGIVQKYELFKTEDLPNIDDAKFSPKVIRDIAQNILSFLKNNATKAGHTYWLFKGKNDDVVKLYDLTSLCSDIAEDKSQNPFTVPVAMLLYRVARNMKNFSDYKRNCGTIRMLLKHCIQLLPKEKYPQIVTSAHYMLADLYVPADTDPANPNLLDLGEDDDAQSECGVSSAQSEKSDEKVELDLNAAIKSLTLANIKEHHLKDQDSEEFKFKPPPVTGTIEERCHSALEHVSQGLECLKYFPIETGDDKTKEKLEKEKIQEEEANVNMAKPFKAIPMPYAPLNGETVSVDNSSVDSSPNNKKRSKQKKKKIATKQINSNPAVEEDAGSKALLCKGQSQTIPLWQAPQKDDNRSWQTHLKILLYEKASLAFVVLAEYEYQNKRYGSTLRYILAVLRCQKMLELVCGLKNDKLISYLLGRAGDCCFMTVQDWTNVDKHKNDYETKNVIENSITDVIFTMEGLDMNGAEILPEHFESLEVTLVASYKCYEKALLLEPLEADRNNLLRRLGNIHNELGVLYMNQDNACLDETTDVDVATADSMSPLKRSLMHFEAGIKAFETVHDEANLALLHSNTGRLMRVCAYINRKNPSRERHFYNKALTSYQKAIQVLGTRETNAPIWDSVNWDMSTTLFTMATQLQDFPNVGPKSEEELEREVVEIFQKALKYCDTETPGHRQPVYQFRAATIQHRLASLYHKIYRDDINSQDENAKRKKSLQLSKLYYEKAAKLLLALEQTAEFLTVQLERVALAEFQAQSMSSYNSKFKAYQTCLELIIQSKPMIDIIVERHKSAVNNTETETKNKKLDKQEKSGGDNKEKNGESEEKRTEKKLVEDEEGLIVLLEQRVQFVLLSLTKLHLNKNTNNQNKERDNNAALYKKCYGLTLRSKSLSGIDLMKHVANVLEQINKILQEAKES
ncbi:erythroid differentiation-related factor 1 [Copidosoma floridanum]|uniref:erythroid differentiation-related factor 1 n=1 Tax=Copidosoma floridanum TaxID=29053 RepID=UPI0006C97446|nr:erythroid differentiation-related factor 1 [Copidosoma floridanum]